MCCISKSDSWKPFLLIIDVVPPHWYANPCHPHSGLHSNLWKSVYGIDFFKQTAFSVFFAENTSHFNHLKVPSAQLRAGDIVCRESLLPSWAAFKLSLNSANDSKEMLEVGFLEVVSFQDSMISSFHLNSTNHTNPKWVNFPFQGST